MNRESKLVSSKDMKKITCFRKYKCHSMCTFMRLSKNKIIGFDSQKGQEIFLFFKTSRPVLGTLSMAVKQPGH